MSSCNLLGPGGPSVCVTFKVCLPLRLRTHCEAAGGGHPLKSLSPSVTALPTHSNAFSFPRPLPTRSRFSLPPSFFYFLSLYHFVFQVIECVPLKMASLFSDVAVTVSVP